jgi:hypothetical protein
MMLLGGLGIGGAETQAIALAAELQRHGHSVTLIALADGRHSQATASATYSGSTSRRCGLRPGVPCCCCLPLGRH